jgi:hypothetical protein
MQHILALKVLSTKFLHCSKFTTHIASANQNIRDNVGHTPSRHLTPSIVTMLTVPFNMQGIYNNTTTQLLYPHYLLSKVWCMLQQRHYIRLIQDYHLSNSKAAMLIFPTFLADQHTVHVQDNRHRCHRSYMIEVQLGGNQRVVN